MKSKLITGLSLLGLIFIFTLQNATIVDIKFLFWTFSMSRALMIFLVLAVGVLLGLFLASMLMDARDDDEDDLEE
ncbi:LapA family protein [Emcibacter sp.]|uniref:LapA family protein n=1 Tax=Emcibacter sp. TaxID=1979954 RepID=UPI002AA71D9C|nr:LapA family protein [Emcibacter sp.]